MNNKARVFIFVGRSGSGKGTQIHLLKDFIKEKYNKDVYHVEMGEILRNFFQEEGYVQEKAKESTNNHGNFQPDFLVNSLLVSSVLRLANKESIFFFDGYPRNPFQLETLKDFLKYLEYEDTIFINLEVSRQSSKERLMKRGRIDDHEEAISNRLDAYDNFVLPMIEDAKKDSFFNYLEINGEDTVENIYKKIIENLGF